MGVDLTSILYFSIQPIGTIIILYRYCSKRLYSILIYVCTVMYNNIYLVAKTEINIVHFLWKTMEKMATYGIDCVNVITETEKMSCLGFKYDVWNFFHVNIILFSLWGKRLSSGWRPNSDYELFPRRGYMCLLFSR